jgi:hypothetical protein
MSPALTAEHVSVLKPLVLGLGVCTFMCLQARVISLREEASKAGVLDCQEISRGGGTGALHLGTRIFAVVGDGVGCHKAVQILLVVHKPCTSRPQFSHTWAATQSQAWFTGALAVTYGADHSALTWQMHAQVQNFKKCMRMH